MSSNWHFLKEALIKIELSSGIIRCGPYGPLLINLSQLVYVGALKNEYGSRVLLECYADSGLMTLEISEEEFTSLRLAIMGVKE